MLAKVRARLSFANVTSLIALFVALGGTGAYALTGKNTVFSDDIASGQVKRSDIAEKAVTSGKVRDNTLTATDIRPNSLGGLRILDNSLTGADVFDSSLAGRDVFDNSIKGADVDEFSLGQVPSAFNATQVEEVRYERGGSVANPEGAKTTGYASCDAGFVVVGGGALLSGSLDDQQQIVASYPSFEELWEVTVINEPGNAAGSSADESFQPYAVCVRAQFTS